MPKVSCKAFSKPMPMAVVVLAETRTSDQLMNARKMKVIVGAGVDVRLSSTRTSSLGEQLEVVKLRGSIWSQCFASRVLLVDCWLLIGRRKGFIRIAQM